jgi:uncharacterized protein (TIGR03437 family)
MIRPWCSFSFALAGILVLGAVGFAQPPSSTSLSGAYSVRYLGWNTNNGTVGATSFSGTITFDGNGGFSVAGTGASAASSDHSLRFLTSGQYQVLPNGMIQMTNPFDPQSGTTFTNATTVLYGGLGNGYLTASSTDTTYCDILVAIKAGSGVSNATLNGTYRVASLEFLNGDLTQTRDTFFSITADGNGNLGTVTIAGTAQNLNGADTTQTSNGATYSLTGNGSGTINFPAPSGVASSNVLLSGNKTLYLSPDGSFFIAGGTNSYDLIVGGKAAPANLGGIYFTSYLENYAAGTQYDGLYSEQGSSNMANAVDELAHQRINEDGFDSYDSSFYDQFNFDANGILTLSDSYWANTAGGNFVIGAGRGSNYQIVVYMRSIPMNLTGAYLNPQGVVNAASSIPFTASFAPGEFISLYGNGFTNVTMNATQLPLPTSLGGVQVTVNGTPAPLQSVSPTQINAIIPYSAPSDGSLMEVKVSNIANSALVYSDVTAPGVFTSPPGGIGIGAMLHNQDSTPVTASNPAVAGEYVQIYCTGLGAVTPPVATGAAAPSNPVSIANNSVAVYIDGVAAPVVFAGLAPSFAGLYQINIRIPAGLASGNHTLEVTTFSSDNYQAIIPIR